MMRASVPKRYFRSCSNALDDESIGKIIPMILTVRLLIMIIARIQGWGRGGGDEGGRRSAEFCGTVAERMAGETRHGRATRTPIHARRCLPATKSESGRK